MSSTITFLFRLASTPMTQLLRGRLAPSRRQLRDQLLASGLPEPTRQLIGTVVKRTKLWRTEQADVQAELIAHFRDGIDAGATHDDLVKKFGDAEATAKLIRRAKIRNRPLWWHARRFAVRTALVLVVVYGLLFLRYYMGRPTVSVDFVARLNEPVLAVPDDDRAWPIYREVIRDLIRLEEHRKATEGLSGSKWDDVLFARQGDPGFATLTDYVTANRTLIERIGEASRKRDIGFVYGRDGSAFEPGNPWGNVPTPPDAKVIQFTPEENRLFGESLVWVLLPNLNHARAMANILCADARVAASQGDGARVARRIEDALALGAQHVRSPIVTSQLVGVGINALAYSRLGEQLESAPSILTDEQLIALAHRMAGGSVGSDVFNLDFEDHAFQDIVQRIYTDDGDGDGRMTLLAPKFMSMFRQTAANDGMPLSDLSYIAPFAVASRREVLAEHARLTAITKAQLSVPWRTLPSPTPYQQRLNALRNGPVSSTIYYMPLLYFLSGGDRLSVTAERCFAQRDALLIVIACELHKRRTGSYPASLDALVPALLPSAPVDPINGNPLKFVIRNGKPLVYSVGADGDDDGGALPAPSKARPKPDVWEIALDGNRNIDGDWVLFPEPREARPASDRDEAASTTQPLSTTQRVDR